MDDFDIDLDNMLDSGSNKPVITNTNNNSNKGDRVSLFKDLTIRPKNMDSITFDNTDSKSFAVFDNGNITDEKMKLLKQMCSFLFNLGYVYRSTADNRSAVDKAIREIPGARIKVYKLWSKAKDDNNGFQVESEKTTRLAYELAANYHKKFLEQKDIVRCLNARTVQVLLGPECKTPVSFMLLYTDCGSNGFSKSFKIETAGFTWFPLKIAKDAAISTFNVNNDDFVPTMQKYLKSVGAIKPKEEEKPKTDDLIGSLDEF